jgi:hypothetical protein
VKKYIKPFLIFFLIAINFIFASWYVLNQDIVFSSDIARDFLLFGEIMAKKIILIGPKSSVAGLFHGPLWLYINIPAFIIGNGNPIIVGWWWAIGSFLLLIPYYFMAKDIFDKKTAILFVLFTSLYFSFHTKGMFNPDGAMFALPFFLYFFVKYFKTKNVKFLIAHIFTAGLIIQFEIAIGIPLFILSLLLCAYKILRSKKKIHILSFLIILVPLFTFIAFDLRHDFLLTHSVIRFLSPSSGDSVKYNYVHMFFDRLKLMYTQVEFIRPDPNIRNLIVALIFSVFLFLQFKDNKFRNIYLSFLYFYIGFYALTLINKGPVLSFYMYPFFPLVFLMFASFVTSRYSKIFLVIFACIYLINVSTGVLDAKSAVNGFIGRDLTSWKFLDQVAAKFYSANEKQFGYFVYTPDVIAYGPKYALAYEAKLHPLIKASYIDKQPITYVVVAPQALDNPFITYKWWKENTINIRTNPVSVINFSNGYKIEKYNFTKEEIEAPYNHTFDPGLGFR